MATDLMIFEIKRSLMVFNSKAIILFFDRYGKLLNQLNHMDQGWDGL
jgi:gliding motility-associated-like protein